ncbi:MAG: L,D-transpeptidase [Desulfuromonadales bacterium]|nr:L,D-transpeptidase [Desulfuromonadales bacterium]
MAKTIPLLLLLLLVSLLSGVILFYSPKSVTLAGADPNDPAKEDLTRVEYPSQQSIKWTAHFIMPGETLESLFGKNWPLVARFNRLDRRHAYPGLTIKAPVNINDLKTYEPMPLEYKPAERYDKYILINLTEQWLGAYEKGKLKFSVPVATGKEGFETPAGLYRIDARDKNHKSSLYQIDIDNNSGQYPMDNAMRFYIGPDLTAYWIHARDLPGRPASHGCVGLFDEAMQKRVYGTPTDPVLLDAEKVYNWAVGDSEYGPDSGTLEELELGPVVEIIGQNPVYK